MSTNVPLVSESADGKLIFLQGKPLVEGSIVVSDFYNTEAEIQRRVTKVKKWPGACASISTDGGDGGTPLLDVDAQEWIRWPKEEEAIA